MRIRKPRGISFGQVLLVTFIGAAGGIYIYLPILRQLKSEQQLKPSSLTHTAHYKEDEKPKTD